MSALLGCCCPTKTQTPCTGFFVGSKDYVRVSVTFAHAYTSTYIKNVESGELATDCSIDFVDTNDEISSSSNLSFSLTAIYSFDVSGYRGSPVYVPSLGGNSFQNPTLVSTSAIFSGSASYSRELISFNSAGQCTNKTISTGSYSLGLLNVTTPNQTLNDVYVAEAGPSTLNGCASNKCRVAINWDQFQFNYNKNGRGSIIEYTGQGCDNPDEETACNATAGTGNFTAGVLFYTVGGFSDCTDDHATIPSLPIRGGSTSHNLVPVDALGASNDCFNHIFPNMSLTGCESTLMLAGGYFSKTFRESESLDSQEPCPGQAPRFSTGDEEKVCTVTSSCSINSIITTDTAP